MRMDAMETNNKELYKSPSTAIVDVKTEGIICLSGTRNGYGDVSEDDWE